MSASSSNEAPSNIQTLLRLVSRAERLEALPRTGWLVCGIANPESIAAHSYMVALIALWIADHIDDAVDVERLLRMALLHDIGEAMLTDLPWPVKQFADPAMLNQAEARAARAILEDSGDGWLDQWQAYERRDSLEARIVKAADQLQMLAKALQYASQNRGDTSRFWSTERTYGDFGIPLVRAVLDELRRMHEAGEWFDNDFS